MDVVVVPGSKTGIGCDTDDPEVPQTCDTVISDQDISLDRMNIGTRLELGQAQRLPD